MLYSSSLLFEQTEWIHAEERTQIKMSEWNEWAVDAQTIKQVQKVMFLKTH